MAAGACEDESADWARLGVVAGGTVAGVGCGPAAVSAAGALRPPCPYGCVLGGSRRRDSNPAAWCPGFPLFGAGCVPSCVPFKSGRQDSNLRTSALTRATGATCWSVRRSETIVPDRRPVVRPSPGRAVRGPPVRGAFVSGGGCRFGPLVPPGVTGAGDTGRARGPEAPTSRALGHQRTRKYRDGADCCRWAEKRSGRQPGRLPAALKIGRNKVGRSGLASVRS
jgi:hypothetical protein